MDGRREVMIRRRKVFRVMAISGVVAAASGTSARLASGDAGKRTDKRRSQYQANSAEVQDFYRVNRYPVT
jgi:hypothetical protein